MIVNQQNLQALFTGFKAAFNTGFRTSEIYWPKIATMVPSSTSVELYAWLGQFPRLREWIGDRVIKSMEAHNYSIKNKSFESTIGVNRDNIEDDSYGIFNPMFQEMGYSAATHPDELIFQLIALGFTTACYDGQYFFDGDHPVKNSDGKTTSVSNVHLANGGQPWYLLDTRRPLKPLIFQKRREYAFTSMVNMQDEAVFMRKEYRYGVDARANVGFGFWQQAFGSQEQLVPAAFNDAYDSMMAFKSDEGRPLGIMPNLLVVGPSNREYANECIKAERLANGASNTNRDLVDVMVVPWLT
jgi:phage major head subunit gpT-like protein